MLTIHAADAVHGAPDAADSGSDSDSVAVDGGVVVAIGPYEELTAARPQARIRRWSGLITPGLLNTGAPALLEAAYHPDPREVDQLGGDPLTGAALTALGMDDARWGASARRGLQRMLRHGTTAVRGPFTRPAVRTAVARSGLRVHAPGPAGGFAAPDPQAPPVPATGLDPLMSVPEPADAFATALTVGGPADLAVFGVTDLAALRAEGAGSCTATVLGGRLVFRRS
ncbi:imidazolonepropionase-like domain-containing protein [Streptomyces sp. A 4/2]|uniref:imidazolonepropionase-like domain-containing protein n=1 Tax=Streptomyces sp. A 4/2 TaxID=2934314 RepID=UPI0020259AB7